METTYYHLDARELSFCDRASGEAAPVARRYACLRKQSAAPQAGAVVLDFAAYRRKLAPPPQAAVEATPVRAAAPRPRAKGWLALVPDLCATLAIVVMAVVVVTRFLPLL